MGVFIGYIFKYDLLVSFRFEHPELLPEACGTPDFPVLLPTAAANPADAVASPGTPGGSANELVLARPLPLISLGEGQGCFFTVLSQAISYEGHPTAKNRGKDTEIYCSSCRRLSGQIDVARHLETGCSQCHLGDEVRGGNCLDLIPKPSQM